jgi:hypothetical protein
MAQNERIVAVGLLAEPDLQPLSKCFIRAFPIDEVACFGKLLLAIDDADKELLRERDQTAADAR